MQLRLVSPGYYRLPQRVEPVEGVSAHRRPASEEPPQQQTRRSSASELSLLPAARAADNARHEFYYSRVEAADGRTARALRHYADIEHAASREQIQSQLGLDLFV